ncbi:MAG TPA: NAD(P)H-binding protein [Thermomicrobiales bacterium]|nr:NAD(P)H-binding protein [Thermomicrobiales bacterium]
MDGLQPATSDPPPSLAPDGPVFVTGGTGFVGGNIREALRGRPLRLLVRDKVKAAAEAEAGIELVEGDVTRPESLRGAMDGCSAVVHLVAIISEEGGATFDGVIHHGTVNVLEEASRAGIGRFIQMSALGARDDTRFPYLQAKWRAEQAVQASGIPWTIFRPSVIFGPGDEFINQLASVVRKFPIIPVVGDGQSTFMPVAVKEVAAAFRRALDDPATIRQIYELGGGKVYTYEAMLNVIAAKLGKRKPKVHVPVSLMMPVVTFSKPLPKALRPPVTEEQLKMLALDNSTDQNAIAELIGQPPTALEDGIDYIVKR